jgi:hypothetical protein
MDNLETKSPSTNAGDLVERCEALQRQSTLLLLGLVVLSGTLSVFLWCQSHYARIDLDLANTQILPVVQNYKQNEKPVYDKLDAQLADYARSHADFAQLLSQYRIQVVGAAPPAAGSPTGPAAPKSAPATPTSTPPAPTKK